MKINEILNEGLDYASKMQDLVDLPIFPNGTSKVVNTGNRIMVVFDIKGTYIPYYISTGHGGKLSVPTGKWYPVFGVAKSGWLNKGGEVSINKFYGSKRLALGAARLNNALGDLTAVEDKVPMMGKGAMAIINRDMQPMDHGEVSANPGEFMSRVNAILVKLGDQPFYKKNNESQQDVIAEKRRRKKRSKSRGAAYGPGPYGVYGYYAGYSGEGGSEGVAESLNSPYSYYWEEGDFGHLNAYAQLSDNTVLDIEFVQINVDKAQWEVAFQRDGQIHKTGKGDEQRVFATVLSAIKEFIENKQPKEVFFSAVKSEVNPESRKRLYDRLVQKYATSLGYQASQSETSRETKYKLSRIREQGVAENFADGKNPGRKGLAKRMGVNCKQSVSKLRSIAAKSSGEKQRMAHWCANMKSGKRK